jgi:beta-phosphoglucomutase-like phosphatase (HAD superfamily)
MRMCCGRWRPAALLTPSTNVKEIDKKTLYALTLAGLIALAAPIASADDTAAAKPRPAKLQTAALKADAPAAPVTISQQDKMRLCAKQAKEGRRAQGVHEHLSVQEGLSRVAPG